MVPRSPKANLGPTDVAILLGDLAFQRLTPQRSHTGPLFFEIGLEDDGMF